MASLDIRERDRELLAQLALLALDLLPHRSLASSQALAHLVQGSSPLRRVRLDLGLRGLERLGGRPLELRADALHRFVLMLLERSNLCRMRLEAGFVGLKRVSLLADQLLQADLELLLSTLEVVAPARQPLLEPLLRLGHGACELGPRDVELLGDRRAAVLPQPALLLGDLVRRLGALAGKRVLQLLDPELHVRGERRVELLAHAGPASSIERTSLSPRESPRAPAAPAAAARKPAATIASSVRSQRSIAAPTASRIPLAAASTTRTTASTTSSRSVSRWKTVARNAAATASSPTASAISSAATMPSW